MVKQKQDLEVGQILYGCGFKTKKISFMEDLITGMKIIKPKIKKITKKYVVLQINRYDKQTISKERIGNSIFLTEKEAICFIIGENKRRIDEKVNSKRSQHLDDEHLRAIKKDLKKWERINKLNSEKAD